MQDMANQLPDNYQLLIMSDHLTDTNEFSYRSAVFIDYTSKEIVFAVAGTRLREATAFHDLLDDARLVMQQEPQKMKPAKELNKIILDSLGASAKEYKFHYTGHSLGAVIADLSAADMDIQLRKRQLKDHSNSSQITSITFENPGTKPLVDKAYIEAGLEFANRNDAHFLTFNNRPNIINSLYPQTGEQYTIIPTDQKRNPPSLIQQLVAVVARYLPSIERVINQVCDFLVTGGFKNLKSEHKLENFDTVLYKKNGLVQDGQSNIITVEDALTGVKTNHFEREIFQKLTELKEKNGDISKQDYVIENYNDRTQALEKLTCSKEELEVARRAVAKLTQSTGENKEKYRINTNAKSGRQR